MTFETLKRYFRWIGILPFKSHPMFGHILSCICGGLLFIYVLTTSWFFIFDAVTFEDYSKSFFYFLSASLGAGWYTMYLTRNTKLGNTFESVDEIIQKRNEWSPMAKTIYRNASSKVEKLTETSHLVSITISMPLLMSAPVIVSFIKYYGSGQNSDAFELLIPGSFPFDWQTPSGFLASAFTESLSASLTAELFFDTLALTAGFCLYASEFVNDLEEMVRDLNENLITDGDGKLIAAVSMETKKKLIEIIRFHSEIVEFCNYFCDLNSGPIFAYLLYAIVSFCSVFLQFNMLFEAGDLVGTVIFLGPAIMVIFWLYLFCIFGDNVTNRYLAIGNDYYMMMWYLFPLDMQMNLPKMIASGHKEIYVRGFGSACCTRELFMKIMKSTFSYFMMVRKVAF